MSVSVEHSVVALITIMDKMKMTGKQTKTRQIQRATHTPKSPILEEKEDFLFSH